jgi:hypothetical protein
MLEPTPTPATASIKVEGLALRVHPDGGVGELLTPASKSPLITIFVAAFAIPLKIAKRNAAEARLSASLESRFMVS